MPTLPQPASQPVPRANCVTDPARRTEAATADVKLLQSRQRPAPDQALRQPRRHYAAPASSDDARIAPADNHLRWLAQVMAPSDGLTARQNRRPCNAICPARSPRATSAEAPSGAPRALGQGLNPMNRLAAAIAIGANAACRGGEKEDLGTKREWCPVSLVVPATLRRSGRTETLI